MSVRFLLVTLVVALLLLPSVAFGQQPSGDPGAEAFREAFLAGKLTWNDVLARARQEGQVRWFHWGGSTHLNSWIEAEVRPALRQYGIDLRTSRIPDTRDAVDVVLADAAAGRGLGQGSVDAIWINGENFRTFADQDLLFGPFADKLPSSRYYFLDPNDPRSAVNLFDFGTPTGMQEMPWSGSQYICRINTALLRRAQAPRDFQELERWLRANPGRFTYVAPPRFDGNTFVQTVAYALNPDGTTYEPFQKDPQEFTAEELARLLRPAFAYLRRIEPFLLGGGGADGRRGSPVYPPTTAALQARFVDGEIAIFCSFDVYAADRNIRDGIFPPTVENIIFPKEGMIKNKNFIAIPANAPNPAAALVLAEVLSTPTSHISKLGQIGYELGVDVPLLSPEDQDRVRQVEPDLRGVTAAELAAVEVPDTNARLVDVIQEVWQEYIGRYSDRPFEAIVRDALAAKLR